MERLIRGERQGGEVPRRRLRGFLVSAVFRWWLTKSAVPTAVCGEATYREGLGPGTCVAVRTFDASPHLS